MKIDIILMVFIFFTNLTFSLLLSWSDFLFRKIPNKIIGLVFFTNLFSACYWGFIYYSLPIMIIVLSILLVLWIYSVFGGGDVKLFCAYFVGIQPVLSLNFILFVGLLGSIVVSIMWLCVDNRNGSLSESGVPYGIAISISGLIFTTLSMSHS